jgi:hypothetical protein
MLAIEGEQERHERSECQCSRSERFAFHGRGSRGIPASPGERPKALATLRLREHQSGGASRAGSSCHMSPKEARNKYQNNIELRKSFFLPPSMSRRMKGHEEHA